MFTGLIQDIGILAAFTRHAKDAVLTIQPDQLDAQKLALGASVACNGVCLTVIAQQDKQFTVQLSSETLEKTTLKMCAVGSKFNLEPALRLGDELGGHLVSGHVDGVGECLAAEPVGESWRMRFSVPDDLAPMIAAKGSIALDGVSLTVNAIKGNQFDVMIIPYTYANTTLGDLNAGGCVNVEIDLLARYVARLTSYTKTVPIIGHTR